MVQVGAIQVWISQQVLKAIIVEADEHYPHESGGVLIGYFSADDPTRCVITDASGPGPHAKHGRYEFLPDARYQAEYIAELYKGSGNIHTYVGDWHTHPDGALMLSGKDKKTMSVIARTPGARLAHPLMAILAGRPAQWELGLWQCKRPGGWLFGATIGPAEIVTE